ncbi:MAG: SMI1/KNR4 family protein [Pseudomonadota bacterium]
MADQIDRIHTKLEQARSIDSDLKAFGARSHRYRLGPVISEDRLVDLETRYGARLPSAFRAFVMHVGNAPAHLYREYRGIAGPFYGIYSAQSVLRSLVISDDPILTDDQRDPRMVKILDDFEKHLIIPDDMTRGFAVIASQGCSYDTLLGVTGRHRGRVVTFNDDNRRAVFAFEADFLDWYERWLDEVIAGILTHRDAPWFGLTMGGDDETLLDFYHATSDPEMKIEALCGLYKLLQITLSSVERLDTIASEQTGPLRQLALELLIKHAPEVARPHLRSAASSEDVNLSMLAFRMTRHAPYLAEEVEDASIAQALQSDDDGIIAKILDVLAAFGTARGQELTPLAFKNCKFVRSIAVKSLGRLPNSVEFIPTFQLTLRDESHEVVSHTLDAIADFDDPRLRGEFPGVRKRFETKRHRPAIDKLMEELERLERGASLRAD